MVINNVCIDKVKDVFRLTGGAKVEVKNLQVNEYGGLYALCDLLSTLVINGDEIAGTEYIRL